ncbi:MAG: YjjG family noncanonical pyrimidine nucleotidase [Bacillota bacterium]|nr:YjjG family noncanonical pyrimidine nucleotidase [Bacillota bacterium]
MKKYQTLLFDVDDTLLDFGVAEKLALRLLFEEQNFNLTSEIEEKYKTLNRGLWRSFEEGKINRDQVLNTRFSILFKEYGKEVNGILLENQYRAYLEQGHQLIDGAMELVTQLQKDYDLYIVSNGLSSTQYRRLQDSGLYPFFKSIFVSEDTGFQKPMKEFFDYVFMRIPNLSTNHTLIIGDSLSSDIKGGNQAGIDTCWFNPAKKENNTDIIPTYEIQKLEELFLILSGNIQTVDI